MAATLRDFRASAIELCRRSRCPACSGAVYAALGAGDKHILCPCQRCGFMLVCTDEGPAGEILTAPDDDLWAWLLASHGPEIAGLRRSIVLRGEVPFCEPPPVPACSAWLGEFLSLLAAAACFVGLALWAVYSLVRR